VRFYSQALGSVLIGLLIQALAGQTTTKGNQTMPAYAPTFTARLRVRYHAGGRNHVQTWRLPGTPSVLQIDSLIGTLDLFYTALQPIMFDDWTHLSTTVAAIDTDIFLPTTPVTIPAGAVVFDPARPSTEATALSFVGRSVTGGPFHMFQYGYIQVPGDGSVPAQDFRIYSGEDGDIAAAILALNTGLGTFVASDGANVSVYPYVNVKANDHYVKLIRQGR